MADVLARRELRSGISPLLVLLIVVLAAALTGGGFLAWQFWGTNVVASGSAADTVASLRQGWENTPRPVPTDDGAPQVEPPKPNAAAWVVQIPGIDLEYPIVAGVTEADLEQGVGWYPGSALPGQVGNFVLAGNRLTHGEPFRRLLELAVGDDIIIETEAGRFTYTLISAPAELTVSAGGSWVIDPVPGHPDEVATQAILTLTTAEDLIGSDDRAVGFATLTDMEPR